MLFPKRLAVITDFMVGPRAPVLLVLMLSSVFSVGTAGAEFTQVTITATVVASPPCVINNDQMIDVNFGNNVVTSKVDGVNYFSIVNYSLVCSDTTSNAVKLMVRGVSTDFNSSALQTNVPDFGIALQVNGQDLVINDWLKFTYPDKPVLTAVPVKKAGVTLSGGDFSAGATLMVDYQ